LLSLSFRQGLGSSHHHPSPFVANVVTYLLVSDPEDPEAVRSHPLVDEHGFQLHAPENQPENTERPSVRFAAASALEDGKSLEEPCRKLSAAFPNAVVTFCEVEERFDQIEHLRSVVFMNGRHAGEIEHGYVFNMGA
jgi:hypothetical protein